MRPLSLIAALLIAIASGNPAMADAGHTLAGETAFGAPGDPKKPSRMVRIAMRETADGKMLFSPNRVSVKKGEQIRFVIRNNGELDHEIVIATLEENLKHAEEMRKNPDMEHDLPNAKRLSSKQTAEILWRFTKSGTFDFSCLIPGHRESGMTGMIVTN